jgi:RNA polymerase sigma factor (TIGR02999 family)
MTAAFGRIALGFIPALGEAGLMSASHEVTRLLIDWTNGDAQALDQLMPLVYRDLRQLAAGYLGRERSDHTLQPTALVHEAYLRLVDQKAAAWQNRSHFYGVAARLMRQILVDHARRRRAGKRWCHKVSLNEAAGTPSDERSPDLLALDCALTELENIDTRKCRAIELHYFGGLSMEETARALDISEVTVRRDLTAARAWLQRQMQSG